MCLVIDRIRTRQLLEHWKDGEPIMVYKVAVDSLNNKFSSPFYFVPITLGEWLIAEGEHKGSYIVHEGAIHCFYTDFAAKELVMNLPPFPRPVILEATAYKEDFIAVGFNEDACFKKILVGKTHPLIKEASERSE